MLLSNTDLLSWCEHVCIPVKGSSQCASTFPPASFNLDDWQTLACIGCYYKGLRLVGCNELVHGGQEELGTVDKPELPEGEGNIFLYAVGDAGDPALHLGDGLQVMEDHRDGRSFRVQSHLEIVCIVGCASVLPGDVAW